MPSLFTFSSFFLFVIQSFRCCYGITAVTYIVLPAWCNHSGQTLILCLSCILIQPQVANIGPHTHPPNCPPDGSREIARGGKEGLVCGDNRWKWSLEALKRWQSAYFGRNCVSDYHSPPYITARPVVTSTETRLGDFVILASDGF